VASDAAAMRFTEAGVYSRYEMMTRKGAPKAYGPYVAFPSGIRALGS